MEQRFNALGNGLDLQLLRNFCEQEGEAVSYQKGEMLVGEGKPSQWFGFVTEGCFKYTVKGISDQREHITWFSFKDEFAGDYPSCLRARYFDLHRATPRERYDLLLSRCPGIVEHLPLSAIASFLNITPKTISMIRRSITFGK